MWTSNKFLVPVLFLLTLSLITVYEGWVVKTICEGYGFKPDTEGYGFNSDAVAFANCTLNETQLMSAAAQADLKLLFRNLQKILIYIWNLGV